MPHSTPEKRRAYQKSYREKNKEAYASYQKVYQKKYRQAEGYQDRKRNYIIMAIEREKQNRLSV